MHPYNPRQDGGDICSRSSMSSTAFAVVPSSYSLGHNLLVIHISSRETPLSTIACPTPVSLKYPCADGILITALLLRHRVKYYSKVFVRFHSCPAPTAESEFQDPVAELVLHCSELSEEHLQPKSC